MNLMHRITREQAITDALRVAGLAMGVERPTRQALAILEALRSLRSDKPAVMPGSDRLDYLERVQALSRQNWSLVGTPTHVGIGGVDTPLGRLKATVWRRGWTGKRGPRDVWVTLYYLDDEPVTIAEIRAAGLARRPTTRNRQKKDRGI